MTISRELLCTGQLVQQWLPSGTALSTLYKAFRRLFLWHPRKRVPNRVQPRQLRNILIGNFCNSIGLFTNQFCRALQAERKEKMSG